MNDSWGGSLHSLPSSHVGRSIQLAWQIPAKLKRTSATRGWCAGYQHRAQVSPVLREHGRRAGGRVPPGRGGRGSKRTRPACPPPPRRGGTPPPAARSRRWRVPVSSPEPSRPRSGGGLAARAGRGSGASRSLRTFAPGAAPGPERALLPPQPRVPGRRRRRAAIAVDLLDAPRSGREVSKVGVCGGGRRLRERCAVLEPHAGEEREGDGAAPGPRSLQGCRAGSGGDGARGAGAAAPRALRGGTPPRARPWRGDRRGWSGVQGQHRRDLSPGQRRGVRGPERAVVAGRGAGLRPLG